MIDIQELERIASQPTREEARHILAEEKAEEARQKQVEEAQAEVEILRGRFEAKAGQLQNRHEEIDNELRRLSGRFEQLCLERDRLDSTGMTELEMLAKDLASQMAIAGIRPPQPGPFLTVPDVAKQLVLQRCNSFVYSDALNGGRLRLNSFKSFLGDSQTMVNLAAIIDGDLRQFRISQSPAPLPQPETGNRLNRY